MADAKHLFDKLVQNLIIDEPRSEKEAIILWAMEHLLHVSRKDILSGKETAADEKLLRDLVDRLNRHEPIQYILGVSEFFGRRFHVNGNVLIPRPETELLVEEAINICRARQGEPAILDIGTGSGCIAITLALEIPGARVTATDVSKGALSVAKKNAKNLAAHVTFLMHDILREGLTPDQLDIIISNPPYLTEEDQRTMKANVSKYEPARALLAPEDEPLAFYDVISKKSFAALKPGGSLLVEINPRFGKETLALFHTSGFVQTRILGDLDGKDRIVQGSKP